jgi:hypothetical protein
MIRDTDAVVLSNRLSTPVLSGLPYCYSFEQKH